MVLEQNNEQHYREVVDKFVDPNVNYEMTTYDYVIRPSADAESGAIIITLPRVAEAKGRFYSIICRNADAANTVTVQDRDDSECWANDIVMNGKCDRLFLYSDGLAWMPSFTGGFPQASTTYPPGTLAPTTVVASSAAPTTIGQGTTGAPTSVAPTTEAPTTLAPTTEAPTSLAPTTGA